MLHARVALPGRSDPVEVRSASHGGPSMLGGERIEVALGAWLPPSSGLVYGVILNDPSSIDTYGERLHKPPHVKPPVAPVLYIKPYNTHTGHGSTVALPSGADTVEVGACLGIVFASSCARLSAESSRSSVAGYTIAIDLSLPKESLYRPPIIEKCFDGACPLGPWMIDRADISDPDALTIRTFINDQLVAMRSTRDSLRPVSSLITDICEFMSFHPGDVLLTGYPLTVPRAKPGDRIAVEIDGLGRLECRLASAGRSAR